jgi:hypothetical protein
MQTIGSTRYAVVAGTQGPQVHHGVRSQHVQLHEINECRAAGKILGGRIDLTLARGRAEPRCLGEVWSPTVFERSHQSGISSRACLIAATILG